MARVALWNLKGSINIDERATFGAVVGVNLFLPDGTLVTEDMLGGGTAPSPYPITLWNLVQEIPPPVQALAAISGTGLYAITGAGTSAVREIQPTIGRTTVANGDGVAGDPVVDLAVVIDAGTGVLLGITRDTFGRVTGTRPVVAGANIVIDDSDPAQIVVSSTASGGEFSYITMDGEPYTTEDFADLYVGI